MRSDVSSQIIGGPWLLALAAAAVAGRPALRRRTTRPRTGAPTRSTPKPRTNSNSGAYDKAIPLFEKLEGRAAGTPLAQQAQLDKAYAQYKADDQAPALATLDRFMKLHPASPAIDYALYLKGVVNFNDDLGMFSFMTRQDLSERDQKAAKESFESFKELVTRFPDSRYTPDARARMTYIVNSLAQYEVHVARYYYSRGAYVAAINRAQHAVADYQRRAGAGRSAVHPGALLRRAGHDPAARRHPAGDGEELPAERIPDARLQVQARSVVEVLVDGCEAVQRFERTPPSTPACAWAAAPPAGAGRSPSSPGACRRPPARPDPISRRIRRPAPCLSATAASGNEVIVEGTAPLRLQALRPRLDQRVVRRRKRQLVDHHQLQRIARHIEAFPERSRRHQHAARPALASAFAEAVHQARAWATGPAPAPPTLASKPSNLRCNSSPMVRSARNVVVSTMRAPAQRCGALGGEQRHLRRCGPDRWAWASRAARRRAACVA